MSKTLKRTIIITLSVLGALLAIVALALWIVPTRMLTPIVQNYLAEHDKELLGRHVTVGDVFLNPYKGDLSVKDFMIAEADDVTRFVGFKEFSLHIKPLALLGKKVHVTSLLLDALDVNAIQRGEHFNFDDIIAHFSGDTLQAAGDTIPAAPMQEAALSDTLSESSFDWRILLQNMVINESHLCYTDEVIDSRINMENITLRIPEIDLSAVNPDVGLQLEFADGGTLGLSGSYKTTQRQYTADISLLDFPLSPVKPYLQDYVKAAEVDGKLSVRLHVNGSTVDMMDCTVSADARMTGLALKEESGSLIMKLDSAAVVLDELRPVPQTVTVGDVYLGGFLFPYEMMADSSTNVDRWLVASEETETTAAETAAEDTDAKPWILTVNRFLFEKGTVTYVDHSLSQDFKLNISDITAQAAGFNPNQQNTLEVSMRVPPTGLLKGTWTGDINDLANMVLDARLTNLDIKALSPYTVDMFGNPITNGQLSFNTNNIIVNNQLKSANRLTIFGAELGNKLPDVKPVYNLPLKTGLYLLTDMKGNIQMDLPVKGDISSPEFSYKKLLWRTFLNVLIKATTSPVAILSGTLGLSGDAFRPEAMNATQKEWNDSQLKAVEKWAKVLQQKPDLCLSLTQQINYQAARQAAGSDSTSLTIESIQSLAADRGEQLKSYLDKTLHLKPEQYSITAWPADSLRSYAGDSQLSVSVLMQE